MNTNYLPTLLEITDLPPNSDQVLWQSAVVTYLQSLNATNSLVFWHNTELTGLTTESARELTAAAAYGNLDKPQQHIILAAETSNPSAQNTLLKTLEEPPLGFHLILAVRHTNTLLPTITSRCRHVRWCCNLATHSNDGMSSLIVKALDPSVSYGELITTLQNYKERPAALALLESELTALQQSSKPASAQILKATLQCWQALQQNANVALTLEEWLFSIHSSRLTR